MLLGLSLCGPIWYTCNDGNAYRLNWFPNCLIRGITMWCTRSRACVRVFLLARSSSRLGDHGRYPARCQLYCWNLSRNWMLLNEKPNPFGRLFGVSPRTGIRAVSCNWWLTECGLRRCFSHGQLGHGFLHHSFFGSNGDHHTLASSTKFKLNMAYNFNRLCCSVGRSSYQLRSGLVDTI